MIQQKIAKNSEIGKKLNVNDQKLVEVVRICQKIRIWRNWVASEKKFAKKFTWRAW